MGSHTLGLYSGYAAALLGAGAVLKARRSWIAGREAEPPARPWLEVGLAFAAVAAVLAAGQVYLAGWLLDETHDLARAVNQVLIFSPLLALAVARGQPMLRSYTDPAAAASGLAVGVVLAVFAVTVHAVVRGWSDGVAAVHAQVFAPANAHHAVQVFLEDVAVGMLVWRLRAAVGPVRAVLVTAMLFAAAHVPAMLAGGAGVWDLLRLVLDVGLGVGVLGAVLVSRSLWWQFPVHFAMDMTQFVESPGAG